MTLVQADPSQWRPRQRIRPKRHQSSPALNAQLSQQFLLIRHADAETHGPRGKGPGLVGGSTRSLNLPFAKAAHPQEKNVPLPTDKPHTPVDGGIIGVSYRDCSGTPNFDSPAAAAAPSSASEDSVRAAARRASASASVQIALLAPFCYRAPTQGIAIRHEYVLKMSKKSKRQNKLSLGGGGLDIMDSLVSSIDDIETKQMRNLFNGHRRQRSESMGSVFSVSPAPVIQTSKSSVRSPTTSTPTKLVRRSSGKNPKLDGNGRQTLRSSNSQEQWLPPIEQEEDIFSVPGGKSYSSSNSNNSVRHPSIPTRTTSITHDINPSQIPQRSNSLLHTPAPLILPSRSPQSRRSENMSDIPSYITRYLRERTDSKENLSLEVPNSPSSPISPRPSHASRNLPGRSRNSTTAIPGNDQYQRYKLVTKRQSSQGFDRDMSATRQYYSLPSPRAPRRSASLNPSHRSSVTSDGSSFGKVNNNYVDEVLSNPKLTQRIRLTSGRILSFSEVFVSKLSELTSGW